VPVPSPHHDVSLSDAATLAVSATKRRRLVKPPFDCYFESAVDITTPAQVAYRGALVAR